MAQLSSYGSAHKQGDGLAAGFGIWPRVFLVNGEALRFFLALGLAAATTLEAGPDGTQENSIIKIDPPENNFFSKAIHYQGIPIKSSSEVVDAALFAARDRL